MLTTDNPPSITIHVGSVVEVASRSATDTANFGAPVSSNPHVVCLAATLAGDTYVFVAISAGQATVQADAQACDGCNHYARSAVITVTA